MTSGEFFDWRPGDIGVERNGSFLARLIQTGQRLNGDTHWVWNHAFVVVDDKGATIEAQAAGVVRGSVGTRDVLNLGCPAGVDRLEVVSYAKSRLGTPYDFWDDVVLGVNCLFGTKFRGADNHRLICSELAALALRAGGWVPPMPTWLIKPADLADELLGTKSATS